MPATSRRGGTCRSVDSKVFSQLNSHSCASCATLALQILTEVA